MNPACPACGTHTAPVKLRAVNGFECGTCRGHFIRGAELEHFLNQRGMPRTFSGLMELARAAPPVERQLICPDCRTRTYHLVSADGLTIDVCSTCIGMYLDEGEANTLLRIRAANVLEKVELTVDAVDAGATILRIVIDLIH
jgi:Zn-finger nucleic acid-binding protein